MFFFFKKTKLLLIQFRSNQKQSEILFWIKNALKSCLLRLNTLKHFFTNLVIEFSRKFNFLFFEIVLNGFYVEGNRLRCFVFDISMSDIYFFSYLKYPQQRYSIVSNYGFSEVELNYTIQMGKNLKNNTYIISKLNLEPILYVYDSSLIIPRVKGQRPKIKFSSKNTHFSKSWGLFWFFLKWANFLRRKNLTTIFVLKQFVKHYLQGT